MTVTPEGHTRGNTPFPARVRDLVLEFRTGIQLGPASFAVLKDNKQWDSVHRTLKAQKACYQDVHDVLNLSYVPSTAEDIVLFKEKQKYMYSVQASRRKKSSLIDRGANGVGIAGIDTRVILEHHPHQTVDICGIDNHEITSSIPIVTAGALARSQWGDVILIMHQYAYHPQQGRLIHASCQLESFANDGNDKLIHIPGGLQGIQTVDGYVFPLSIRDGLPYLGMRPYTDVEYEPPPHVILTSDVDWDQRLLDFDIDEDNDWYDAISDNMNHSELFDAFSNYTGHTTELEVSSADTWFDTVTPDQYTRVQLEEAMIVCSEHAYRVHHFDNDDFNAVLLVNDTELVDTTGPVTEDDDAHSDQDMSNTEPDTDDDNNADAARGRIFKVQDPDYDKLSPLSGWNPCKRCYQTLKTMMNTLLDRSGSPGSTWLLCLMYVMVLLNLTYNWTLGAEGSTRDKLLTALHRSNLRSAKNPADPNLCLDPLDGENLPQPPQIVKSVQDDAEDVSDQVKPMIYFDTGDLVGRTFLLEEDDDGLCCRAHIIEVLDNHEKNVANNPVLKQFKSLVKTNLRRFFLKMKS